MMVVAVVMVGVLGLGWGADGGGDSGDGGSLGGGRGYS